MILINSIHNSGIVTLLLLWIKRHRTLVIKFCWILICWIAIIIIIVISIVVVIYNGIITCNCPSWIFHRIAIILVNVHDTWIKRGCYEIGIVIICLISCLVHISVNFMFSIGFGNWNASIFGFNLRTWIENS